MLLQNKSFLACNGLRYLSGAPAKSGVIARSLLTGEVSAKRNRFVGEASFYKGDGTPSGYSPTTGSWYPNRITGGMGSRYQVIGSGLITRDVLAGARQGVVNMVGVSSTTFTGALIMDTAINLLGIGELDASIQGALYGAVDMVSAGELIPALGAIAGAVCDIIGNATINAQPYATGSMGTNISSSSILSPENMAAAVWNSLAAQFVATGTMGKALSDAGGSGNPWGAVASANQDPGTMGEVVNKKLLKTGTFIALK